jgi:hypothetical protein
MNARLVRPVMVVFAALQLSACRVVVDTNINDNGSGELRSSVVFSEEEKANFEGSPENEGKSVCDNLREGSPADTEFTEEVRGDETFCTTVRSFANLNELRGFYERMGNVTVNELKIELIKLTFEVQLDLTPKGDNKPAANEWRLTLPGKIGNNNAESIEGQTLIWKIEPGELATLHAESSVSITPLIWVMIGLAVLLGVVSILLLRQRS